MRKELQKRIFTSFILTFVLLFCLFLNKFSWLILLIIASIISFIEFNNLLKKIWKNNKLSKYLISLIFFVYLLFFIYSASQIYQKSLTGLIFILMICIFSDIGGYIVGKTIGGKKLTKISPNKTISGAIGSFVFSLVPLAFYLLIYEITNNNDFKISNIVSIVFLSLSISFICQLGDLLISYFKRKAKVKDTGSLLPGHGGVLDRIDGIMFGITSAFIINFLFFNL